MLDTAPNVEAMEPTHEPEPRRGVSGHLFRLAPLVLMALGVAACVMARPLELGDVSAPGPGLWPAAVSVIIVVTAGLLIVRDIPEDYEPWSRHSLVAAAGFGILAIFIQLFQVIGFLPASVLMLFVWLKILAKESWRLSLVLAVVGALILYLVFGNLFEVPFPEGVLFSMSAGRG
jgi:putative tricarboxylic transport membrane protein